MNDAPQSGPPPTTLAERLRAGDRRALARGITLVESAHKEDRGPADELLASLLPHTGGSIRLGITGVPGVGKSSFIERFGLWLIERGHRVAVLAVDPSSALTGGSILGDKTRMESLGRNPAAFIRPSPAGRTLGGVARRTREALLLCEAAGYDVVLVETVGVGQSETAAADLVDIFVVLLLPGGGDELQGLKKGIVELADLLVVNKADGERLAQARQTATEYRAALHLLRPRASAWVPRVELASAATGEGIEAVWERVAEHRRLTEEAGELARRRAAQARTWLWRDLEDRLIARLRDDPGVAASLPGIEAEVAAGTLEPGAAARRLIAIFERATPPA